MWAFLSFLFLVAFVISLIAIIFRRWRRKGALAASVSFVGLVICMILFQGQLNEEARKQGFADATDFRLAKEAGITNPATWRVHLKNLKAEKEAAAEEQRRTEAAAQARRAELLRPPFEETSFIEAVQKGREQYKNGQNDLQRGAARPSRARALCSSVSNPQVSNWIGTLSTLSTNSDGNGVVSIKIADHLHLVTWNNSISDIGTDTLIKAGSPLYQTLLQMKVGSTVRVDGMLFSSDTDCYRETSLTLAGSLEDPEFLVRFSSIERVELP